MSLNWNKISPLPLPITTTPSDVMLSGHGAFLFNGNTTVPSGMEFWVMAPPGASISDSLGQALESMAKITKLGIYSQQTNELSPISPVIYKSGQTVPNYILQSPNGITLKPGGPHLIGVSSSTMLSELWARVAPFSIKNKTIRVFWAACSAIDKAENQIVYYQ
jgi:hypothetical protein